MGPRKALKVDFVKLQRCFFKKRILDSWGNTWSHRIRHIFLHWLGRKDITGISWLKDFMRKKTGSSMHQGDCYSDSQADEIPVGLTKNVRFSFSWWWWVCKSLGDCTDQLIFFVDLGLATLARSVFTCFFQNNEEVIFTSTCVIVRLLDSFFEKHTSPIVQCFFHFFPVFVFLCLSTGVFHPCFFWLDLLKRHNFSYAWGHESTDPCGRTQVERWEFGS